MEVAVGQVAPDGVRNAPILETTAVDLDHLSQALERYDQVAADLSHSGVAAGAPLETLLNLERDRLAQASDPGPALIVPGERQHHPVQQAVAHGRPQPACQRRTPEGVQVTLERGAECLLCLLPVDRLGELDLEDQRRRGLGRNGEAQPSVNPRFPHQIQGAAIQPLD